MLKLLLFCILSAFIANANVVEKFEKLRFIATDEDVKIWVLLIAGSNGYFNYRHQADVCHSYQVVHNHGIPDEQIVVMMYDDIANADENPTKGIVINHPDGKDVYHGVPKDYTGEDVTPENFLNILTGNANAMKGIGSGKIIGSGPKDHVFVYFADHGAPGLIAFPSGELMKDDFNNAIMKMYKNNQYAQMVIYVEACESGSMFEDLLRSDINVYATTAANSDESSYACYYDAKRQTYLGDRYSVSWLEDSDKENIEKETLHQQYQDVKADTNTSHVMQYGNIDLSKEIVGLFQGQDQSKVPSKVLRPIHDDVPSPDVTLHILRHKLAASTSSEERSRSSLLLSKEEETRRRIQWTTRTIATHVTGGHEGLISLYTQTSPKLTNFQCYKKAVAVFDKLCYELDDHEYAYRQLFVLANLCDADISLTRITSSIQAVCN